MGVDLLRGGGGRGHFLVASFALLSLFLLFNWWSLSTDNLDLLKQIEGLTQHLKSSSTLLDQCRNDRSTLESRVKQYEEDTEKLVQKFDLEKEHVLKLESSLKESNKETVVSQKKFDGASSSWKMCVTELESLKKVDISKDGVIASMRIEKSDLSNQIQDLKEETSKLRSQVKQEKLEQSLLKKSTSSTVGMPPKVENEGNADNEVKNLPEPYRADEKDLEHKGDHIGEKDDPPPEDERELEMHGNGDERRGANV